MNNSINLTLSVSWHKRWFSRYLGGHITSLSAPAGQGRPPTIKGIYKHSRTGQVRIYTHDRGWPLTDATISINGQDEQTILGVGRWGRLHFVK